MGLTDKHLAYGDDIPQTQAEKDLYWELKNLKEKQQVSKKDTLLEELAKEDLQVLSLAYIYAKNLQIYGEDVTKAISTATQNVAMLEKAYQKGYYDAMNKMSAEREYKGWIDYQRYINALRKYAKEHENDITSTGHIIVSDLCKDTANLLETLDQKEKKEK